MYSRDVLALSGIKDELLRKLWEGFYDFDLALAMDCFVLEMLDCIYRD